MNEFTSMNELFSRELQAQTDVLQKGLSELKTSADPTGVIEPMLRAAHSLKGAALIMDLKPISELIQAMTSCLLESQTKRERLEPAQVMTLQKAIETLQGLLSSRHASLKEGMLKNGAEIARLVSALMEAKREPKQVIASEIKEQPGPTKPVFSALDPSMLRLFFVDLESQTHLLRDNLLTLEANPQDPDVWTNLMRAAHSIKGAARILKLADLVTLAHSLEDCFVVTQQQKLKLEPEAIDSLLNSVDILSSLVRAGPELIGDWLESNRDAIQKLTETLRRIHSNETKAETVAKPSPATPPILPQRQFFERNVKVTANEQTLKRIHAVTRRVHPSELERVLRLTADDVTRLMGLAAELLVESRWLQPFADSLLQLKKAQYDLSNLVDSLRSSIDETLLGEEGQEYLLELQRKTYLCRQTLAHRLEDLELFIRRHGSLSDRLYREVISSRMCPLAEGVEELPRMVRDLARQLHKKVIFEIVGRSTTIDRDILDKLQSPLQHLLRNAVDHGIELPDERVAKGKRPEGLIRLEARHHAGVLSITVSDDGRGINLDQLRKIVVEKRLVDAKMAEQLTESELLDFLFLPGFTTSSNVTDISGRGVGLNVVQSMVHEVGGQVRVQCTNGHGMAFHLQLPLTLSVLRALLVEISGEPYAFPLARIQQAIVVPRDRLELIENRQYVRIDTHNIGLIPGYQILGLEPVVPMSTGEEAYLSIVVLSDNFNFYGIVVDKLLGEKELVVQELEPRLGKVSDISCGALMEDGSPVLVIDVEDMIRSADNVLSSGQLSDIGQLEAQEPQARPKRVLVVDDSATVREVQCRILESQGYQVDVAINGVDGWNSVRIEDYDLVITDIDMPRMNGIDLVRSIRKDPRLHATPVMIVSYKERDEDRKKAIEAGAQFYLGKSSFHDDTFIEAVKHLLETETSP